MAKSAFDAIAKTAPAGKSKTNKLTATVTDVTRAAVDALIRIKAEQARLEAEKKDNEEVIISTVRPQQDAAGFKGEYSKSYTVEGPTGSVLFNTSDRFSVPKEPAVQAEIKEFLDKDYESVIEEKRVITLKAEAADNKELISKVLKAVEAAGFTLGDVFDVTDTLVTTKDLDRRQYEIFKTPSRLEKFRNLITWWKPSIK